jgi:hypothetical protein
MRFLIIDRDAEEFYIFLVKFVVRITERACFKRSTRGVVFGIKEQDHSLTLEVR